ncbi:expressed unknown protein [Seminavis robusta]|uniref:Uncharacterized protein n=1 Tax=Seminavis robusta TaxID=568900 RepID=A0A9N8DM73_9STRA|nr:expressed unknown protein [Seminavis robusta]|eukprot:Sro235_g094810.1 n/a (255) ;mRNA; f:71003-71838
MDHPDEIAPYRKQGAKCCCCCCDYRRAVIAVAIVLGTLEGLVLLYVLSGNYLSYACSSYYYGTNRECEEHFQAMATIETIFSITSIVLGIGAIWGAMTFNAFAVGLNAAWIVVGWILGVVFATSMCNAWNNKGSYYECYTVSSNIAALAITAAFSALFVYPHVGFIVEVQKGIMSKETYEMEKFSCCCISNVQPQPVSHQVAPAHSYGQVSQQQQAKATVYAKSAKAKSDYRYAGGDVELARPEAEKEGTVLYA